MEKETIYLSSAYLAPVEYYTKLLAYSHVCVEDCDHYLKQTYRNRCTIAAPDGPLALSVPIIKPDTLKCPMKDIRISDHGNWRHLHWNALESAYNHTPFFEYYKDDFRPFYRTKVRVPGRLQRSPVPPGLLAHRAGTADGTHHGLQDHLRSPAKTTSANASTPRRNSARRTPTSTPNPITRCSRNGWASCPT